MPWGIQSRQNPRTRLGRRQPSPQGYLPWDRGSHRGSQPGNATGVGQAASRTRTPIHAATPQQPLTYPGSPVPE